MLTPVFGGESPVGALGVLSTLGDEGEVVGRVWPIRSRKATDSMNSAAAVANPATTPAQAIMAPAIGPARSSATRWTTVRNPPMRPIWSSGRDQSGQCSYRWHEETVKSAHYHSQNGQLPDLQVHDQRDGDDADQGRCASDVGNGANPRAFIRSARAPPISRIATRGSDAAATTAPTCPGVPIWMAAQVNAKKKTWSAHREVPKLANHKLS